MLSSVTADLNILGNPQIFKNPNGNEVTIAANATNVSIILTPVAGYNSANTNTANTVLATNLANLGFVVTYQLTNIAITRATAGLSLSVLTAYNFDIRNSSNVNIDTENISIEILSPNFTYTQSSCSYCVTFANTLANVTSQNPFLASRGKLDYIIGTDSVSGNYNQSISYCDCEAVLNQAVRSTLTIREIPNCGGTSPIVFQAVYDSTITITEYKPLVQYEASLKCCIPLGEEAVVTPVDLQLNNSAPHDCVEQPTLKYTLINSEGEEVIILSTGAGTISTNENSVVVTGSGTSFTSFPIGGKLYDSDNNLLGIIASIDNNFGLSFEDNATSTYTGQFKKESFFYTNPNLSSIFSYTSSQLGTYTLTAILSNCCTSVTNQWSINICKSYLVETGTCNNPTIKNLSGINYLRINLTTYNGISLLDQTTNEELYKDTLISPLSGLAIDNLPDGYYKLIIEELDDTAIVLSTETQYLFFDCNIVNCQVKLTQDTLCFETGKCVDQSKQQYLKKNLELLQFYVYKDIIYSYWSKLMKTQSTPDDFDPESHLQEIATYTEAITWINKLCQSCNSEKKHCYSFVSYSKDYQVYVNNSNDCGCNK